MSLGICMWKECRKKAEYVAPLDYPKLFLCTKHYEEHKRLTDRTKCKLPMLKVYHSSFSDLQRKRNLKEKHW